MKAINWRAWLREYVTPFLIWVGSLAFLLVVTRDFDMWWIWLFLVGPALALLTGFVMRPTHVWVVPVAGVVLIGIALVVLPIVLTALDVIPPPPNAPDGAPRSFPVGLLLSQGIAVGLPQLFFTWMGRQLRRSLDSRGRAAWRSWLVSYGLPLLIWLVARQLVTWPGTDQGRALLVLFVIMPAVAFVSGVLFRPPHAWVVPAIIVPADIIGPGFFNYVAGPVMPPGTTEVQTFFFMTMLYGAAMLVMFWVGQELREGAGNQLGRHTGPQAPAT